jgi:putative transposase
MEYKLSSGAHSVHALQYHLVQCVKYRRRALVDADVVDCLKMKIREISGTFDVEVLNVECDKDHFHLLFRAKPTLDIPKYLNAVKTISSRVIRQRFPKVRKVVWGDHFWSPSYFIASSGQVTLDQLMKYVAGQGKHVPKDV